MFSPLRRRACARRRWTGRSAEAGRSDRPRWPSRLGGKRGAAAGRRRRADRAGDAAAQPVGPLDPAQAIAPSADWTPVLLDASGSPVLARLGLRRVYLLADPDVIDTRGLATPEGARGALGLFDDLRSGAPVVFDVTLDGFGAPPNLLRLLFEPPLLGATLCGSAAGLLVLLMGLNRFGPVATPERVHEFGKRALADHSAGLIALAGREPRLAGPYARLLRGQVLAGLHIWRKDMAEKGHGARGSMRSRPWRPASGARSPAPWWGRTSRSSCC